MLRITYSIRPLPMGEVAPSMRLNARKFMNQILGTHTFAEPFDRSLNAAVAVRDLERLEADFDDTQGAQDHRGVDVSHMGDPKRLATELADPDPEHHAAFLLAIALQRQRIMAVGHHDGRDRVGALGRFG